MYPVPLSTARQAIHHPLQITTSPVDNVRDHTFTDYQAGRRWARQSIDVSIVAGSVLLSRDGTIIRVHPIRHDRARELGAFANPKGRPRRKNSAAGTVA